MKPFSVVRSWLFVPGHLERLLNKAKVLEPDVLILDLEDAVPPSQKDAARIRIRERVKERYYPESTVTIRVNSLDSGMLDRDLEHVVWEGADAVMLSKPRTREDVQECCRRLSHWEKKRGIEDGHFGIVPLIETPSAVLQAYPIATASPRVRALAFGSEDYLTELVGTRTPTGESLLWPRSLIAAAARAAGAAPVDTVYYNYHDLEGFEREARLAKQLGFAGSLLVHPCQMPVAHRVYSPSEEEVEEAKRILRIVEKAAEEKLTVAIIDGRFVGPPLQKRAESLLRAARAIEARKKRMERASENQHEGKAENNS